MIPPRLVLLFALAAVACAGQSPDLPPAAAPRGPWLSLRNDLVALAIDRHGGALVSFAFHDLPLNPMDWRIAPAEMPKNNQSGAPFQGHFLCVGRWGSPTEGEKAAGIPHNGEPANRWWETVATPAPDTLVMSVLAPLEQWRIQRKVNLAPGQSKVEVEETLTNLLPTGRFTALVQHATLGGAFLDAQTVINSNAGAGFNQALIARSLVEHEYRWPDGRIDAQGTPADLTKSEAREGYVTTHVIDGDWGWATAANPARGLLIGYVWKTSDYPWLHVWHGMKDGRLWAKGIEFGTTGLGDTFAPEARMSSTFHGRNHQLFVDAHASVTRSYVCFLLKIPADFQSARSIAYSHRQIEIEYQAGGETIRTNLAGQP
jgi:hypothetical protein